MCIEEVTENVRQHVMGQQTNESVVSSGRWFVFQVEKSDQTDFQHFTFGIPVLQIILQMEGSALKGFLVSKSN